MSEVGARPVSPFKGLAAFEDSELDALFFFGREREREVVVANLLASRVTLLYGESGVGKSSLLKAAVIRDLRRTAPDAAILLVDVWSGPLDGLLDSLRDASEAYLILDQFEEFFLYHRDEGLTDLSELLLDSRLNVLIALREDALAELDAFKAGIPAIFANQIRLEHLDREAARAAILGPIGRWNELASASVEIEPALLDAVLEQCAHDGERIEAPYLQLVLEQIWAHERDNGSSVLRLETLTALGEAAAIVRSHLLDAVNALTPHEQDVAAEMFEHLVTPSGTKIALRSADLAEYAGVPSDALSRTLSALTRDRIVHSVDGSDRYEIFHDVLVDPIQSWRQDRRLERERRAARRRNRKLLAVAIVSSALLAVVAAVALFALAQRSHARSQARHARVGELAATALADLPRDPVRSLEVALSAARIERSPRVADVLRSALLAAHLRLILPTDGAATSAEFSPHGSQVAIGSGGGRVDVYDLSGSKRLYVLHGVTAATFSPDGRELLASAPNRALLRRSNGKLAALRHPHLRSAVFSSDGKTIATAGKDAHVRIWRARDGRLLHTIPLPGPATQVALTSSRGAVVWTIGSAWHVLLFDPASGQRIADLLGSTVEFSRNGRLLATGDRIARARVYDAQQGTLLENLYHGGPVTSVDFNRDGTQLVTGSADGAARTFLVATGTRQLLMPSGTTVVESARFSSDGRLIVTGDADGTARIWNARNGRELVTLSGHRDSVTDGSFSPDGRLVVTASLDGTARIWETGQESQLRLVGRAAGPVLRVGFDGNRVFAAARHGIDVWRAGARKLVASLTTEPAADGSFSGGVFATVARTGAAALTPGAGGGETQVPPPGSRAIFSPDGGRALFAGGRGVEVDPVHGGRLVRVHAPGRVTDARFAPDGRFAVATANGKVGVYDRHGRTLFVVNAGSRPLVAVAFSPDGSRVAAAGRDGFARIWSSATGKLQHKLRRARTPLTDVEFSPDGRYVATAAIGGEAKLWTAADGRLIHILRGHTGKVARVAFSPDSYWVLTAGPTSVGLWQTSTGHLLLYLRGHTKQVEDVTFDGAGRRVLSGSDDETVRLYTCNVCGNVYELAHLAHARLAAIRSLLTVRERKRYLGG